MPPSDSQKNATMGSEIQEADSDPNHLYDLSIPL